MHRNAPRRATFKLISTVKIPHFHRQPDVEISIKIKKKLSFQKANEVALLRLKSVLKFTFNLIKSHSHRMAINKRHFVIKIIQ